MTVNRGPLKTAEEVHTNSTVLTLLGLEPNTHYTICIEAVNSGMILVIDDQRFWRTRRCRRGFPALIMSPIIPILSAGPANQCVHQSTSTLAITTIHLVSTPSSAPTSLSNDVFEPEEEDGESTTAAISNTPPSLPTCKLGLGRFRLVHFGLY